MKNCITAILVLLLLLAGCRGQRDKPRSGTALINNELFGSGPYYSFGFSFDLADKVSTLGNPGPDFSVEAGVIPGGSVVVPFLSANTLEPSFGLYGEYGSENEAVTIFNGLTSFGTLTWQDMGAPLRSNQVWIIRTGAGNFAKIRTIEVLLDEGATPPFSSCKFQWVYQPDGTSIFPAP